MKAHPLALTLALTLSATAFPQSNPANPQASSIQNTRANPALAENYGKLPLSFEANQGQSDPQVKFLSKGNGYTLFLTNKSAVLALTKTDKGLSHDRNKSGCPILTDRTAIGKPCESKVGKGGSAASRRGGTAQNSTPSTSKTDIVRMELTGSNPTTQGEGNQPLPGTANYFLGNDPSKWHTNVPTYAKVSYKNVYPGVDLLYYGNQRQLEYDFIVQPKANPKQIKLHFAGAQKLTLDQNGDLEVVATNGQIAFHKPVIYQIKQGQRQPIAGTFTLKAHNEVGFKLGTYDQSQALVIDPVLAYSTYLGGSYGDTGGGIAVDAKGNAYLVGLANSTNFPVTSGALQQTNAAGSVSATNAFIAKLNPTGTALIYSTYLGGSGAEVVDYPDTFYYGDFANAIAIDSSGNAYVTGSANSTDFPVTPGAFQTINHSSYPSETNAFVAKINPTGTALVYSTYLGGSGEPLLTLGGGDVAYGIAIDAAGDAFVVGSADSADFPVTEGAFQTTNKAPYQLQGNGFVTKLNPQGSALIYSTYLGGTDGVDSANALAIDSSENAYIVGSATSLDFPVTPGAFLTYNGDPDGGGNGFVSKLNPTGSALVYSTFLGGSGYLDEGPDSAYDFGDSASAIAVDNAGNAYVTGYTVSSDFPVTSGAFEQTNAIPYTGTDLTFVTKLNPTGSSLVYSTYLGGEGGSNGAAITVDASGHAYVVGSAASPNFPVTPNAIQKVFPSSLGGAFVSELNSTGSGLIYSTALAGSGGDSAAGIALDSSGNAYLVGGTASTDFPVTSNAFQKVNRAAGSASPTNAFVAKLNLASLPVLTATTTAISASANPQITGSPTTFTAEIKPASGTSTPTGNVTFTDNGAALGTEALNGAGVAQLTTTVLGIGTNAIEATYSGDTNFYDSVANLKETITGPPNSIAAVSGTGQTAVYGSVFANPLVVEIFDVYNNPVSGATVTFSGTGLEFASPTATTNANGQASIAVTAGSASKTTATASVTGVTKTATFKLTGTKAPLTITANNDTAPYGQAIPAFTYTPTGFVNGDTTAALTGAPEETSAGKEGSAVGTYPIKISTGSLKAANYSFTFVDGTLTITSLGTAAKPAITPAAGTYHADQTIAITDATKTAVIHYTKDGTTPTSSSDKYTAPFTAAETETIKAIAIAPGYTNSAVTTAAYTITLGTTTTLTSSLNPSTSGKAVTFTAKVKAVSGNTPTGTVTFKNGTTTLGSESLSNGAATLTTTTLPVGTLSITAAYSGSATDEASISATLSQVVNK